ncbi:MAG: DUF4124 domain-containing protein [Deltaproteobacteria bacterium]|nr:MAG: DUF4124 domain-containing protein [Deltaproteobacteria bacterium]TMA54262.1 MAG: DUF4124 domain-containing protein [Deltaproteobacteria bacterium]
MRSILLALTVTLAPALVGAEEVWRWKDGRGVLHYSNHTRNVPADAAVVKTPITLEVKRLPGAPVEPVLDLRGGQVMDSADRPAARRRIASPARSRWLPDAPRIYDAPRLRFGCYTAGVLYYGGFAHADDISGVQNCYPYRLGPEAWLNTARAELGLRQSGINPRDVMELQTENAARQ